MSLESISLAPKSVLTVNRFIPCDSIPEDMSRVTVSADWFQPIVKSDEAVMDKRFNGGTEEPILTPIETGVLIMGAYYNVYDCNGTIVFYRKDTKDTVLSTKSGKPLMTTFVMYTDEATKIHVPQGKEIVAGVRYVRPNVPTATTNAVGTPAESEEDEAELMAR